MYILYLYKNNNNNNNFWWQICFLKAFILCVYKNNRSGIKVIYIYIITEKYDAIKKIGNCYIKRSWKIWVTR